jgi:DNA segregation ATPase FtsK/SpoIIIE-like protein
MPVNNKATTDQMRTDVIDFFLNNKDNTIPIICKRFNIGENRAGRIIDSYFREKMENK